jgi:hypothetical protein
VLGEFTGDGRRLFDVLAGGGDLGDDAPLLGLPGVESLAAQHQIAIVAHENTRLWMSIPVWVPAEDRYRPARPKAAHPTETFRVDGSMTAGRERIDYGYLIEAHTSGDIYIYFRDSRAGGRRCRVSGTRP